ncbi:MAG: hypothetical protein ALECFALPRED_005379 [Alectoria fallacina]|uniref:Uncharacterized protein n=1 Tax=Alectoria fallacina TaxID=1903189 RepID=A0A8H3G1D6_9LECA|nr:MAG: hypothetical protein ALECFALPRED_005379 [Alectoria fallacina]
MLDPLNGKNSSPAARGGRGGVPRCDSTSATRVVTTRRQPPADVAVQIVLWNTSGYFKQNVVNALGSSLKIDPRFFEGVCDGSGRHFDPKHITIGGTVATVLRHYIPDKLDVLPIVLVARMEWESTLANAIEEEIGDVFPFQYPAVGAYPFYTPQNGR